MSILTKRRNPFGDELYRPPKIIKHDMEAVYEKTLRLLMKHSRQQKGVKKDNANNATNFSVGNLSHVDLIEDPSQCYICAEVSLESVSCSYCEHVSCLGCSRQCTRCGDVFCSFCSTVSYNTRHDRTLCLNCNYEETQPKSNTTHSGGKKVNSSTIIGHYKENSKNMAN